MTSGVTKIDDHFEGKIPSLIRPPPFKGGMNGTSKYLNMLATIKYILGKVREMAQHFCRNECTRTHWLPGLRKKGFSRKKTTNLHLYIANWVKKCPQRWCADFPCAFGNASRFWMYVSNRSQWLWQNLRHFWRLPNSLWSLALVFLQNHYCWFLLIPITPVIHPSNGSLNNSSLLV